jgi:hypothetical protein
MPTWLRELFSCLAVCARKNYICGSSCSKCCECNTKIVEPDVPVPVNTDVPVNNVKKRHKLPLVPHQKIEV